MIKNQTTRKERAITSYNVFRTAHRSSRNYLKQNLGTPSLPLHGNVEELNSSFGLEIPPMQMKRLVCASGAVPDWCVHFFINESA